MQSQGLSSCSSFKSSNDAEGAFFYNPEDENNFLSDVADINKLKTISVGDFLPYGPRMYFETNDNIVRMKDIGEKNRILVVGVIGSFTPDCWNRHLFLVLRNLKYLEERGVDYICCISTNDAYTQRAWATYLGCEDVVLMLADTTKRFTTAMGMNIVVPWLDNNVRSRRYILLADNMLVTKMITGPLDNAEMTWECEHFFKLEEEEEGEGDDDENDDLWM